jgi:aryl-alcohol dehydrogenase-like predicted oxidoreductase
VVGKAGIIEGRLLAKFLDEASGRANNPEIVKLDNNFWYCISPDYLEEQITQSLAALQMDCLDVFLLNNPEYYFACHTRVCKAKPFIC